jgi:hypothetical protein
MENKDKELIDTANGSITSRETNKTFSRKNFLKLVGASAVALGIGSCELNSIPPEPEPKLNLGPDPAPNDFSTYLGSGDTGLLNLIYAVEQLQAAYFTSVMENPYPNMTDLEERILNDIRQHEVAHRDFYAAFLGENGIPPLGFEFFSTDFSSRQDTLSDGRQFQDIGVSMYNSFTELFENPDYLNTIIGIASVEARHAAAMRNLLQPQSTFFIGNDIISANGLDAINSVVDVFRLVSPFIIERLDIRDVPRN